METKLMYTSGNACDLGGWHPHQADGFVFLFAAMDTQILNTSTESKKS